jgi:hypothetical protein
MRDDPDGDRRALRDEQLRARLVDRDPEILDRIDREVASRRDATDDRPHDVEELRACGDHDRDRIGARPEGTHAC